MSDTKDLQAGDDHGNSTFLSLPPEIRQLIYQHVFSSHEVSISTYLTKTDATSPLKSITSILRTNRLCRRESKPIFFAQTKFHLEPESPATTKRRGALTPTCHEVRNLFGANAQHVSHICFRGRNPQTLFAIHELFPRLALLEIELREDYFDSDHTDFDTAAVSVLGFGEWKSAIREALDQEFVRGTRDVVAWLRHLGPKRGFKMVFHWRMAHGVVQFKGVVDLDEWILRVSDPNAKSTKVYEIPQNPLEPTWCEGRLTLPAGPGA